MRLQEVTIMNKNILLCGVGGQGTVLASKLIASAAMAKNIPVMSAETIGMAQRGGSVFSHLRLGDNLYSPMIQSGTADMILGFEPGETVRMLPFLRKGGHVVASIRAIQPVTATLQGASYHSEEMIEYLKAQVPNLTLVDGDAACRAIGSAKVLNMVLLGAAIRTGEIGLTEEDIKDAIRRTLPERFHELNFRALDYSR